MATVIVTGGGRGIGRGICLKFAESGANIVINYAGNDAAALETKAMCEALGAKAEVIKANVADFTESASIIDFAIQTFGGLDILVNNAGVTKDGLILRMSEEDFQQVMDVNLKGTFNCIRHASKVLAKQRKGRIINLTSVVGIMGNAGQANYAASKAGIIGLTKSVAKELASRNITVNAVAPGFIETDMTDVLKEEVKQEMKRNIPLGSFGTPKDIAAAVYFLASEDAKYITGQILSVNGGMLM